jgi:flavin reductase (DIM6/NTAB) family NADH-FMN oxidoreductase RutF
MAKRNLKPTAAVFPVPVVLVTCQGETGAPNIITISYIGILSSKPPMIGIGVRPGRYSYGLIEKSKQFVVNIPSEEMLKVSDFCGTVSGRNVDKFEAAGLTPVPSEKVKAPAIEECPVHLECEVKQVVPFESHDLFMAEIVALRVEETVLQSGKPSIDIRKALPFSLCPAGGGVLEYWGLRERIGAHGFTKGKI